MIKASLTYPCDTIVIIEPVRRAVYLDVEEGELQPEFPSGLEHDDEQAHQTLVVTDYHGAARLAVQVELLHLAARRNRNKDSNLV